MKLNPVRFFAITTLLITLLLLGAMEKMARSSEAWAVYDLPIEEVYRDYTVSSDTMARTDSRESIHVARVEPGKAYRLGLKLRSDQAKKISVSLFDRWPYAEGASPTRLATGGGFRGAQGEQEFQWWFSVDKGSPGSLVYFKIAVEPGFISESTNWKYQVFIVDSPRSPMNSIGRGVVYHRGPSNLKLQEKTPSVVLRYRAFAGARPVRHVDPGNAWGERKAGWLSENNLIKNGDFDQGLASWHIQPDDAAGIGVYDGKLRIWSDESLEVSGVRQQIDANVAGNYSSQLSMDIMIAAQTEPYRPGGPSPLTLSICYEDIHSMTLCGDKAFLKYFAINLGDVQDQTNDVVFLPVKEWSLYNLDFMEFNPKPRRITSIELSGNGAPERDVWIKSIKFIR